MTESEDIEAIKRLKAQYFRLMDTGDWDAMRELFVDDVEIDFGLTGGTGTFAGVDELFDMLVPFLADRPTVHHGHMPEVELTSATTATGIWAMEDRVRRPGGTEMHGFGHYHETYRKQGGTWRIASLWLTRLRVDFR